MQDDDDVLVSLDDEDSDSHFGQKKKSKSKQRPSGGIVFKEDTTSADYIIEQSITLCTFEADNSEIGDDFSQRGSKSKKASIIKEGRMPKLLKAEDVPEFDLVLHESAIANQQVTDSTKRTCGFCQRTMNQSKLIGPFVLSEDRGKENEADLSHEVYNDLSVPVE